MNLSCCYGALMTCNPKQKTCAPQRLVKLVRIEDLVLLAQSDQGCYFAAKTVDSWRAFPPSRTAAWWRLLPVVYQHEVLGQLIVDFVSCTGRGPRHRRYWWRLCWNFSSQKLELLEIWSNGQLLIRFMFSWLWCQSAFNLLTVTNCNDASNRGATVLSAVMVSSIHFSY